MTRIRAGLADAPLEVDVLVVGLGVTGAGCALDAAARGLSVLAVDAHDLAFGTSRWSSKLVHGGLRYLASGQVAVARESAVERGILMETTAPHLTHALPMLLPLDGATRRRDAALLGAGFRAGDLLRIAAGTSRETLPRPRRISATECRRLAPVLTAGTRGGILAWDGQLEDDARLVTTIARTAARLGAQVRTRARVLSVHGLGAMLRDELTGTTHEVTARAVVNAAGVWSGDLVDTVRLRPSRGTHLVLDPGALSGLAVALTVPVPGERNRFLNVVPQQDGPIYLGLTDVPVEGERPDVPEPTEAEVEFLLQTASAALARPLSRADVVGSYAGLRPLLRAPGRTADLSRRHAVLTSGDGVVTVVGGKLTTYRRMAQDAVDAACRQGGLDAGPCTTARLPLAGAAPRPELARLAAESPSPRLVRRFGADAALVLASGRDVSGLGDAELLEPVADGLAVTLAELLFGITHEGAHDVGDLLDRRTRVGLRDRDRGRAEPAARRALTLTRATVR
ncbi:MAG TPA: glycerol-3-phosphate dehydrogenase/oxidase [Nocardioides sp.]|uniref:glycerol-3-phosphate dehydrogenase/oxidase n=1 Tax=Nocardioides sp. TaxID=35761 RepID=UPI002E33F281|nr:glycerol-3-phosphate dehydrogenase/oxidase [Nocardioides sp.]HEX3930264.1 glycerol-3-phosphate dehydrogenase/oxidase [Nocardioides sp.]